MAPQSFTWGIRKGRVTINFTPEHFDEYNVPEGKRRRRWGPGISAGSFAQKPSNSPQWRGKKENAALVREFDALDADVQALALDALEKWGDDEGAGAKVPTIDSALRGHAKGQSEKLDEAIADGRRADRGCQEGTVLGFLAAAVSFELYFHEGSPPLPLVVEGCTKPMSVFYREMEEWIAAQKLGPGEDPVERKRRADAMEMQPSPRLLEMKVSVEERQRLLDTESFEYARIVMPVAKPGTIDTRLKKLGKAVRARHQGAILPKPQVGGLGHRNTKVPLSDEQILHILVRLKPYERAAFMIRVIQGPRLGELWRLCMRMDNGPFGEMRVNASKNDGSARTIPILCPLVLELIKEFGLLRRESKASYAARETDGGAGESIPFVCLGGKDFNEPLKGWSVEAFEDTPEARGLGVQCEGFKAVWDEDQVYKKIVRKCPQLFPPPPMGKDGIQPSWPMNATLLRSEFVTAAGELPDMMVYRLIGHTLNRGGTSIASARYDMRGTAWYEKAIEEMAPHCKRFTRLYKAASAEGEGPS